MSNLLDQFTSLHPNLITSAIPEDELREIIKKLRDQFTGDLAKMSDALYEDGINLHAEDIMEVSEYLNIPIKFQ